MNMSIHLIKTIKIERKSQFLSSGSYCKTVVVETTKGERFELDLFSDHAHALVLLVVDDPIRE